MDPKLRQRLSVFYQENATAVQIIAGCSLFACLIYVLLDDSDPYKANLITESISIAVTSGLVDYILKQRKENRAKEEREQKKKEEQVIKQVHFSNFYYICMSQYRQILYNIFGEDQIQNNSVQFVELAKLFEPYRTTPFYCDQDKLAYHYYFTKLLVLYNESKMILVGLNSSLVGKRDDLINEVEAFLRHNMYVEDLYAELQNREIYKAPKRSVSVLAVDKKNIQNKRIVKDLENSALAEDLKQYAQIYPEIFRTLKYNVNFIKRYRKIIDKITELKWLEVYN